jgi:predicted chitinase
MPAQVTADASADSQTLDPIDATDVSDTLSSVDIPGAADALDMLSPPDMAEAPGPIAAPGTIHRVIARHGLYMRGGPGTEFPALQLLPYGTQVSVLKREGQWALVDMLGDSAADGFVFSSFLAGAGGVAAPAPAMPAVTSEGDQFILIKPPLLQLIMDRCANTQIKSKLDLNVVADALTRAMIKADANTRKREVGFLSQAVIETDFFRTFKEYGAGAGKSYAPYYGRGMHQLTWRDTYAACSKALFSDDRLVQDPDLILKDIEMNIAATAWFWRDYKPFNRLADAGDIDGIIYRLYGGKITSPNPKVRRSVLLRRSYYKTIDGLLDQHSAQ